MRRVLIGVMLLGATLATGSAQTPSEREAVLKVVQIFFDTMTARDAEGAGKILVLEGQYFALEMRKPGVEPQRFSNQEYLARLTKSTRVNRERIWNPDVRVRGSIATVWAPYDFWTDGKYSHCGVDAFDLIKTAEGWKIAGLMFTLEATCDPSPLGPLK